MRHDHPRRASGSTRNRTAAATPDRKLATCQPVNVADLMAAPPVENRNAAVNRRIPLRTGYDSMALRQVRDMPHDGDIQQMLRLKLPAIPGCARLEFHSHVVADLDEPAVAHLALQSAGGTDEFDVRPHLQRL